MKSIKFTKMEGAGNDFIIIDDIKKINLKKLAIRACDRKTGIGADGLIVCCKSKKSDYRMRIINADGSEAEMCGNGARCIAAYIAKNKTVRKKQLGIETVAGTILAKIGSKKISVRLSNPKNYRPDMPIRVSGRSIRVHYIDTGVPHAIIFVDKLGQIAVNEIGKIIRYHTAFRPRGTNADFVEQIKPGLVKLRTYERGVEAETLACGTGAVASAIVSYLKSNPDVKNKARTSTQVITTSSQVLSITFSLKNGKISDVWLTGSANFVAKGEYYV